MSAGSTGGGQFEAADDPAGAARAEFPAADGDDSVGHGVLAERRQASLERRDAAARAMLDALGPDSPLDRELAEARITAAFTRIYDTGRGLPGGAAGIWIVLLAFLAAPALLLEWSGDHHSFVVDALLYAATLLFGGFALLVLTMGYFTVADDPFDEQPDVLWAWMEFEEPDHEARRDRARFRRRRILGATLALAAMIAALRVLQEKHGWLVELACIVFLAPLLAALLASIGAHARAHAQPWVARRSRSPVLGDVLMVNLLNLAFVCVRSAGTWDAHRSRGRILTDCERVAAAAELEFFGVDGLVLHSDATTAEWARQQSARLAATLRELKRPLLLSDTPERFEAFTQAVSRTLKAAVEGDWDALTTSAAPSPTRKRLRRVVTALVPAALLVSAAFALPEILGAADSAVVDSIRASLLVAGFLALVGSISPDSRKAADVVQSVADRFGGSRS